MPRRAARIDRNQPEIRDELRALGFLVAHTHTLGHGVPDLLVSGSHRELNCNVLVWVEVKYKDAELTKDEERFHKEWRGHSVIIARTTEDVLEWFGWKTSTT